MEQRGGIAMDGLMELRNLQKKIKNLSKSKKIKNPLRFGPF